jgi:hypothetical protein
MLAKAVVVAPEEMSMGRTLVVMLLGMTLAAGAAAADETNAPACKKAEINPVTGHVFCIDPLGAAVEAPPEDIKPNCDAQSRGQWTWAPNCTPEPQGAEG